MDIYRTILAYLLISSWENLNPLDEAGWSVRATVGLQEMTHMQDLPPPLKVILANDQISEKCTNS